MVFGLFKKKEPVKVTIKSTGDEFMCEPGELLMKAALKAKIAWPLSCKVADHVEPRFWKEKENILQVLRIPLCFFIKKK